MSGGEVTMKEEVTERGEVMKTEEKKEFESGEGTRRDETWGTFFP